MSKGNLKPQEGNRLADVPLGKAAAVQMRFAACNLTREAFERAGTDLPYAQGVTDYMLHGYDAIQRAAGAREELEQRRKHRKRLLAPSSVRGDDTLERFCAGAAVDPEFFLRTAALSFVRAMLPETQEQEVLVRLEKAWPAPVVPDKKLPPQGIAATGLLNAMRCAIAHLLRPRAAYIAPRINTGFFHPCDDLMAHYAEDIATWNPALFLEQISVEFVRLFIEVSGSSVPLANCMGIGGSIDNDVESTLGEELRRNCVIVGDWYRNWGGFPNPMDYSHSLFMCCDAMSLKHGTCRGPVMICGQLSQGIRLWMENAENAAGIYFSKCPYCGVLLHTPRGAKLYEKLSDRDKASFASFLYAR